MQDPQMLRTHRLRIHCGILSAALLVVTSLTSGIACRKSAEVANVPQEGPSLAAPVALRPSDTKLRLPQMSLTQFRDHLESLRGKVVVVDLWALW